jgi:hypothetical protein
LRWIITAIALAITAWLVPGIYIVNTNGWIWELAWRIAASPARAG